MMKQEIHVTALENQIAELKSDNARLGADLESERRQVKELKIELKATEKDLAEGRRHVTHMQKQANRELNKRRALEQQCGILKHQMRAIALYKEDTFETVLQWNLCVGHHVPSYPGFHGKGPSQELGWAMVEEEFQELQDAWEAEDLVEFVDALADLKWVVDGLAVRCGIDLQPVWEEVKRSNYDKLGGPRREDGKLLKPKGWKGPNIKRALEEGRNLTFVWYN
jgi:hypothetical protein